MLAAITQNLKALYEWSLKVPYLRVLIRAGFKAQSDAAKDLAASIAYFTFLSLFPLVLGLVSLGGYVLKSEDMQIRLMQLIVEVLPTSSDWVESMTDSVVRIRGTAGITSALILIWSAKKMFGALSRTINRALGQKRNYEIYWSSLRNFGLTLVVSILIVLALAISPLLEALDHLQPAFMGEKGNAIVDAISGRTTSIAVTLLLVGCIYTLVPHNRLSFKEILPGLVTATLLIEAGKTAFGWYITTSTKYSAIYGSMSSIIVLMIWLYVSALVVVYGAEVIAVNGKKE